MKFFRILLVDDKREWAETFQENLQTVTTVELTGREYDKIDIKHVTNQLDADQAISEGGADGYDLILLDLRYPLTPASELEEDEQAGFQGMNWLPDLRRLQPNATIVILTSFARAAHLQHVVEAIRDYDANDFIPKTTPFDLVVARLRLAAESARSRRQLLMLEEEFRALVRTRATRTYAEDVAVLLNQAKASLLRIAQRIETRDPTAIGTAPDAIRSECRLLKEEFEKLSELLDDGQEHRRVVDVAALLRQMLLLYEKGIERAQARSIGPDEKQSLLLTTYEGDLKLALHEVLNNALDSLEHSVKTPSRERVLECTLESMDGIAVICIRDNGDGFSDEAVAHMFERGYSSKKDHHRGLGLHIAKRMMNQIGGDIEAKNWGAGGAEIEIIVRNLN